MNRRTLLAALGALAGSAMVPEPVKAAILRSPVSVAPRLISTLTLASPFQWFIIGRDASPARFVFLGRNGEVVERRWIAPGSNGFCDPPDEAFSLVVEAWDRAPPETA